MNHLSSSKIRHFFDAFTGKHDEITDSVKTVNTANATASSQNFWGHGFESEGLKWDEYGNPYIVNDTVH